MTGISKKFTINFIKTVTNQKNQSHYKNHQSLIEHNQSKYRRVNQTL